METNSEGTFHIQNLITSTKFKAWIAIIAAIVMYFTPNNIDRIIEALLGLFGISALVLEKKDDAGK
jgi:hypothetical protein